MARAALLLKHSLIEKKTNANIYVSIFTGTVERVGLEMVGVIT